MMHFEEIWPRFSWVIDEMKNGMCFFEGYIPSLGQTEFLPPLSDLAQRTHSHSFKSSIWSSGTSAEDWDREYSIQEYVDFFSSGRLHTLAFDYGTQATSADLFLRLLFDRGESGVDLEVMCYRDTLLSSSDPKQAIAGAILELRHLKHLFQGDALFIGPDTVNVPKSATDYSDEWLRIE